MEVDGESENTCLVKPSILWKGNLGFKWQLVFYSLTSFRTYFIPMCP